MSQSPVISSVLVQPALSTIRLPADPAGASVKTILVGLVLNGKSVAWGSCDIRPASGWSAYPFPLDVDQSTVTIREQIAPLLEGKPLNFRSLTAQIASLREVAVVTETVQPAARPDEGVSRRALLTGRLGANGADRPRTRQTRVERPIHPALRFGFSQALLAGTAMARGEPAAAVLAAEYALPQPDALPSLQGDMAGDTAVDLALTHRLAALGLTLTGRDPVAELGLNAARIQKYVRQLATLISQSTPADYRPIIHLDFNGGLGRLYENNIGKMLGTLVGLEKVAAPYPLCIANPFAADSAEEEWALLAELKSYLRLRGTTVTLATSRPIESPDDLAALLAADAVDAIQLDLVQLGTLHETIEVILTCRQHGLAVHLAIPEDDILTLAADVALAVRPDRLRVSLAGDGRSLARLHNALHQSLAAIHRPAP